ncbi:MAG TPA: response regulator [Vicinamibacterales bacterium]|jgi:PAS domain S-box-containing protein
MVSIETDPIRVLVVDDDSQLLRTLSDILHLRGYDPWVASSAREGLAIAAQEPAPAIALVDLKLPDMDGLELIGRLRSISGLTETVILTGNASVDTAVRALREQSHDYLLKPVAPERLLETLSRASERWRRHSVEEALRHTEERSHLLLESITDIVAVLDAEGCVNYSTASFERTLGYALDVEGVRRSCFDVIHDDDLEKFRRFLDNLTTMPGETRSVDLRLRHRDGSWRAMACQVSNLYDRPAIGGFLMTARDVTEAQQLERQFRQAQKMELIGNLAGGIAHDFNNLLTAILGYSELLLSRPDITKESLEDLEEIRRAGQRAAALTRQLLAFSRQQPTEPKFVNIGKMLKDLARMLERLIGEQIVLEIRDADDLQSVFVDPTHLEQVVVNLVVNARDAMENGGTIAVETENVTIAAETAGGPAPGEYVRLSVRDSGTGMTEEVRARVFEPFFTTKEAGKGTGLGLATCYGIVQQANGAIVIESQLLNGTTVHTYWPASSLVLDDHERQAPAAGTSKGNAHILVVDDDIGVRRLASAILRANGYLVTCAANGTDALEHIERGAERLDLVLTDVVLPGINGWDLAAAIRARHPNVRVVLMSGYEKPLTADVQAPTTWGLPLAKPFSQAELTGKIRQALEITTTS